MGNNRKFTVLNNISVIFILFLIFTIGISSYAYVPVYPPHHGSSSSDPTVNVLPSYNDTYANWKNAGLTLVGGISTIDSSRVACTTAQAGKTMPLAPSGVTPPASNDDSHNINTVITNCPVNTVIQLAAGTFQLDQSEWIILNKSITLRGTGNCTNGSSPYCSTVINVYNGAIADWLISGSPGDRNCGVTAASTSTCTAPSSVILMSPSGLYDWGWGGACSLGSAVTSCGTTLAADVAQGATTVQVANNSSFSVGMWVLIDEDPQTVTTANPTGGASFLASPEFLNSSGSPNVMRGYFQGVDNTYNMATNRVAQEIHLVTAKGAGPCPGVNCTLTFDDPLTMGYRQSSSHDARVFWPTTASGVANPFLQQAGVENLTVTKAALGGINLMFCAYCWIKNVEVGNWVAGGFNIHYSARSQVDTLYIHDCTDCEPNGNEYPFQISSGSTETLVQNSIIVRGSKGMVGRASNTSVIAYNYVDDTFYMPSSGTGDSWLDMSVNGSHLVGTHHWLFEGNWGNNCDGDETHGNAMYMTFFRNDCTGIRATFTDPSNGKVVNDAAGISYNAAGTQVAPGPLRAAGPMAFNYWYGFVGNVLGLSGVTTSGNGWVYRGAFCGSCSSNPLASNNSIWMSGWVGGEWTGTDPNLTTTSNPWIFRHGNYDYVTPGIADWATGYSQTLPNSFYLASQPSFFGASGTNCTYSWPWVTSNGSPQIKTPTGTGCTATDGLPAKARFVAGTPFVQP